MTDVQVDAREAAAIAKKGRKAVEKKAIALERLEIKYVPVGDVKPNSYNPNRQSEHDFELLLRSMREDGFTQPIIVLQDMTIVDGEHRWRAAQALGLAEIPVVITDMTPEQMRISTLRHNRARGSEDIELSSQLLRDLRELGALDWAQDSLMLDDADLQRMLEDVPAPEALASEEFSQGWQPAGAYSSATADKETNASTQRPAESSSTLAAADAQRKAEAQPEAKTEEERKVILQERGIFRIALTFTGDESKVVRQVLGDQPAIRLLALCQAIAAGTLDVSALEAFAGQEAAASPS